MSEQDNLRILFVEDNPLDAELAISELKQGGFAFIHKKVDTEEHFLSALTAFAPNIIISDYSMPSFNGMQALLLAKKVVPDTPFLILTGSLNEDIAVECMKAGADDYVIKERIAKLPLALRESLEKMRMRREKEAVEFKLREKIAELDSFFLNSLDMFCIADTSGYFHRLNMEWTATLGYKQEELEGSNILDYVHPKDIESTLDVLSQLADQHDILNFVNRLIAKDGSEKWIEWRAYSISRKIYAAARDISDRILAEKRLQESEDRYKSIFHNSHSVMLIIDPASCQIVDANPAAAAFYGYPVEQIKQMKISDFNTLPTSQIRSAVVKAVARKRNHYYFQHRIANGQIRDVESFVGPISVNGRVLLYSIIHDITSRRKVEESLRYERRLMHTFLQNTPDYIYFKDDQSRYIRVNPAVAKSFGLTNPAHLIGKSDFDFLNYDHACQTRADELTIMETGVGIGNKDEKEVKSDGTESWLLTTKMPLVDRAGKIVGTFGISRDISERKRVELELEKNQRNLQIQNKAYADLNEALINSNTQIAAINAQLREAKERAEESDRLKSSFLSNMSHEIRTPMNGLLGFSEMLTHPNLDQERKGFYIDIIRKTSNQLLAIINDILDMARIETNQVKVFPVNVALYSLMENIEAMFTEKAQQQAVRLILSVPDEDKHVEIISDEVKITQVITNLVGNALKFTSSGSVEFGYKRQNEKILFFVKDTGIGIARENFEIIFQRFRQVETDLTRTYGGSGLGLSISKAFVEVLGGRIWLESEVGRGTIFYFTIPNKYTAGCISKKFDNGGVASIDGVTILVAEDEEINYLYISELLENSGVKLIRAQNGQEAVDLCQKHPEIQQVLMDIKMPLMNGVEATKAIREFRPDLPIIATTAYALSGDRDKFIKEGCTDYIPKPIKQEELLALINKHLKSV